MKVINKLTVYEIDDKECFDMGRFIVESHWVNSNLVILYLQDGTKVTVAARELLAAITNAMNAKQI